jgi:signal transduction histidine kinase
METVRMTGLIDSLLLLARADAGMEALRFEPVDGNRLSLQVGEKWKTAVRLAFLDFTVETAEEPVWVIADVNGLQRLLTILLDNAVRYTQPGGSVYLRVGRQDDRVLFTVQDTGIGIAPEHQPRVFDRFYRVDRTRGSTSRGSGLGLALAKWIAEKHGTVLLVESSVGQGSSFGFALPLLIGAAPSNSDAAEYSTMGSSRS